MAQKQPEQRRLAPGQVEPVAIQRCLHLRGRVAQLPQRQLVAFLFGVPAHQRPQPRLELALVEGLHEVVVGAEIQRRHPVVDGEKRGQHQHRRAVAAGADLAQEVAARAVGQVDVEHQRVVALHREMVPRGVETPREIAGDARFRELRDHPRGEVGRILDHQHAHGFCPPEAFLSCEFSR